jgi:hypothetical protein
MNNKIQTSHKNKKQTNQKTQHQPLQTKTQAHTPNQNSTQN